MKKGTKMTKAMKQNKKKTAVSNAAGKMFTNYSK